MIDVALCIAHEHDPWLVALAVFVCCAGAFAIVQMFARARATRGAQRLGWLFLTAVGAGATIWCTHFVAMLAYRAGVPVRLDPVLTIASLIVAVVGTGCGFGVAAHWRGLPGRSRAAYSSDWRSRRCTSPEWRPIASTDWSNGAFPM
ncbi:MAG TPA: MHYT domain-containing protein [Sphingomonas sp.]|nr:MHYT domain-containing protein [Sphingomonas sp.]